MGQPLHFRLAGFKPTDPMRADASAALQLSLQARPLKKPSFENHGAAWTPAAAGEYDFQQLCLRWGRREDPGVSGSDPIACLPACVSPWAFLVLRGLTQAHAPGLGEKTGLGGWEAVRGHASQAPSQESRSSSAKAVIVTSFG